MFQSILSQHKKTLVSVGIFLAASMAWAQPTAEELDALRTDLIVKAFNSQRGEFTETITADMIHIKNGIGRANINRKVKFSYYIYTEKPTDPNSKITLIPLATSRYAPTYYQTDEWWDEHKAEIDEAKAKGLPQPKQDAAEVKTWLREQKLSTNPLVFIIDANKSVSTQRLNVFLYNYYVERYAKDGKVTLFRGGERVNELDSWKQGSKPRGARYWTPTATYGWRYARKNGAFMADLLVGKAPVYTFEVPLEDFRRLTLDGRYPDLTLGVELTKSVHKNFDSRGQFVDDLTGREYMGIGSIGIEFEVRGNSAGSTEMIRYFKHATTIRELVLDRIDIVRKTQVRLNSSDVYFDQQVQNLLLEGKILFALQNKMSKETIESLWTEFKTARYEPLISNTLGGTLNSAVQQGLKEAVSKPLEVSKELKALEQNFKQAISCQRVF